MTRRIDLVLITLLLLLAAFVRINALSRLPIGFNDEEITYLRVAETARAGQVSVFYDIGNAGALDNAHYTGREVLFPALEALSTALSGDGLLCYRIVPMLAGLLSVALAYALGRRLFGTLEGLVAAGSSGDRFMAVVVVARYFAGVTPIADCISGFACAHSRFLYCAA